MVLACFRTNLSVVLPTWPAAEPQCRRDHLGPDRSTRTTTSTRNPPQDTVRSPAGRANVSDESPNQHGLLAEQGRRDKTRKLSTGPR